MKKWLTSLFLLLALAGGVLAGTPLHSGRMDGRMMDCCDKAKSHEQTPASEMARLCCAINCTDSSPTSSSSSFNFSPSAIIVSDSIARQIARLLASAERPAAAAVTTETVCPPRKLPPKYIQHHSILI